MLVGRLDDIPVGEFISLCLYGPAGGGKTHLCGTLGDRTVYCSVEDRLATLQSPAFKAKHKFNPIVISVRESHIPDDGAKALADLTDDLNKVAEKHLDEFDHIVVDGATAIRRFAMNMGLEVNLKTGKTRDKSSLISGIVRDFPYGNIEVNDYQTEMSMTERFIQKMLEFCADNKKNFIFTAHQRVTMKKKANVGDPAVTDKIYPGFTGQTFPDQIPGMFDLVWYAYPLDASNYGIRTVGDSGLIAKTCYPGIFPTVIQDGNLLDCFQKIKENKLLIKKR